MADLQHATAAPPSISLAEPSPAGASLESLVGYLRDCLAEETARARTVNVLAQRDLFLFPLAAAEQHQLAVRKSLDVAGPDAAELANRVRAAGSSASLVLGALFLVGQLPERGEKPARRYCAPLLEVRLTLTSDLAGGRVVVEPAEDEFSVNYGLVAELLEAGHDDLHDRLTDLAGLVPDFPIDPVEFEQFWAGFRLVAARLPVAEGLPEPRRGRHRRFRRVPRAASLPGESRQAREPGRMEIVDFYVPTIPSDEPFRLLPATAVVLEPAAGRELSAVAELEQLASMHLAQTSLEPVFAPASRKLEPERAPQLAAAENDAFPLPLSATQAAVVLSARTAPLTVVTGPPGTGKSYTITALVLDCLLRGQSVLVASQMDKAVEVVADRVEALAGPCGIARSGGRPAQRALAKKINALTGPRATKQQRTAGAESQRAGRRHAELAAQRSMLEARFRRAIDLEHSWSESREAFQRLAPICPLPVHDIDPRTLRRARRAVRWSQRLLDGEPGALRRWLGNWQRRRSLHFLGVPDDWNTSSSELAEALRVHQYRQAMGQIERELPRLFTTDLLWEELRRLDEELSETALKLLDQTRQAAMHRLTRSTGLRRQLRDLATLLRRRDPKLKRALKQGIDPGLLLRAFPAWACTNRTLGQILPLQPALFDLVIIDEASQCDLATAALALARGRRAVVVGDPQQLRHVSFLGRARETAAFARHGIPEADRGKFRYSRSSLFDIAADAVPQEHFFLLDEHFRSQPQIIGFSNRHFYDGQLRIMTEKPRQPPERAIELTRVAGRRLPERSANPAEVEAVLEQVRQWIAATPASGPFPSIGVVSPFRDQVDAILERIARDLPAGAVERHALVVGTAHSLQGDEKDLVIFSTSIDRDFHPASLRFLENPNLFNVAVTRARHRLVVVNSVSAADLPPGLLRDYLVYAEAPEAAAGLQMPVAGRQLQSAPCSFRQALADALAAAGMQVWPDYPAAGFCLDLVASRPGAHAAVACDGGRDRPPEEDPLNQHRILGRAGWQIRRISHRAWLTDWFACVQHIQSALA